MATFLGVISNNYQHPSDDDVLEFTNLDMLVNFLFNETRNLLCEFQRKAEFITEQEINLTNNLNQITEIFNFNNFLWSKTFEIENEVDKITCWLNNVERCIDVLETVPPNFAGCKCSSNPQRSQALDKLVKLSEECIKIEEQLNQTMEEENYASVDNPFDLTKTLVQFLDMHTKILENIEQKVDKITDQLKQVDGLFINAHKRSIGACYHKPRHDLTQSFC